MKRPFAFEQQEIDALAENANALSSWLAKEEVQAQLLEKRIKIPAHLLLISATVFASGLPVLLDKYLPTGGCWAGGGCSL